jgi:hypothetical protein
VLTAGRSGGIICDWRWTEARRACLEGLLTRGLGGGKIVARGEVFDNQDTRRFQPDGEGERELGIT